MIISPGRTPQSCSRVCRSVFLLAQSTFLQDCQDQAPSRIRLSAGRLRRDSTTRRQPTLLPVLTAPADQMCGTSSDEHCINHKLQSQDQARDKARHWRNRQTLLRLLGLRAEFQSWDRREKWPTTALPPAAHVFAHARHASDRSTSSSAQSFLQPPRIQLADGEWPVATLRASLAAHQPVAAFTRRVGQRSIHNLDKLLVGRWQGSAHIFKAYRIKIRAELLGSARWF